MSKTLDETLFDVRTVQYNLKKGRISRADLSNHFNNLPNDEENFELSVLEEDDDIGLGEQLSAEELENMPPMSEDEIDNFDFMKAEKLDTTE